MQQQNVMFSLRKCQMFTVSFRNFLLSDKFPSGKDLWGSWKYFRIIFPTGDDIGDFFWIAPQTSLRIRDYLLLFFSPCLKMKNRPIWKRPTLLSIVAKVRFDEKILWLPQFSTNFPRGLSDTMKIRWKAENSSRMQVDAFLAWSTYTINNWMSPRFGSKFTFFILTQSFHSLFENLETTIIYNSLFAWKLSEDYEKQIGSLNISEDCSCFYMTAYNYSFGPDLVTIIVVWMCEASRKKFFCNETHAWSVVIVNFWGTLTFLILLVVILISMTMWHKIYREIDLINNRCGTHLLFFL